MALRESPKAGVLTRGEWLVFAVVTLANLIPIWVFRYFPGQDTGDHLYAVEVLRALGNGTAPPGLASAFASALSLKTNVLFHGLMLGLLRLGLSIELAHRLVLSGYALALPLAGLFCVRAAAPASAPLALLLLPLVWSWFAIQGLYNYVLSLPPALVWLGIVARDGGRPRPGAALTLAASALVVFLAHAVTFSVLLLVTVIRIAFPADGARVDSETMPAPAARLLTAGPVALALLPSLVLAAASWRGGVGGGVPSEPTVSSWEMYDFPSAIGAFFVEFAMRYHLIDLAALGPPLLVLLGAPLLARWTGANAQAPRWPLHAAAILVVLYLLFPHIVLGSDLTPRLRPLVVFALLCYSGVALSPLVRRRVVLLALASGLGGAALLARDFRSLGRALDDFSSGIPFVRRGSRVYPVIFDPRSPSLLVKPFLHAWGYYGLARDVVTPYAFAWHATRFPYRYRELPLHPPDSAFPSDAEDEPYALVEGRLCTAVRRFSASLSCDDVRALAEARILALGTSYDYLLTWAAPADFRVLMARPWIQAAARTGTPRRFMRRRRVGTRESPSTSIGPHHDESVRQVPGQARPRDLRRGAAPVRAGAAGGHPLAPAHRLSRAAAAAGPRAEGAPADRRSHRPPLDAGDRGGGARPARQRAVRRRPGRQPAPAPWPRPARHRCSAGRHPGVLRAEQDPLCRPRGSAACRRRSRGSCWSPGRIRRSSPSPTPSWARRRTTRRPISDGSSGTSSAATGRRRFRTATTRARTVRCWRSSPGRSRRAQGISPAFRSATTCSG